MTSPEKAKGSQWERDVAGYFNERGYDQVERRYGAGNTLDKGDINGLKKVILECKNVKSITLSAILGEALREQENAKAHYGIAIIKRRNRGAKEAYAVMTLEQLVSLLAEAGRC